MNQHNIQPSNKDQNPKTEKHADNQDTTPCGD